MKRTIFSILLFLVGFSLFSENVLYGKWKVETFGQKETSVWIFENDDYFSSNPSKSIDTTKYTINENTKEFKIVSDTTVLYMTYEEKNNCIYFYFSDITKNPLYSSFQYSMKSMKGINSLTDEVSENLWQGMCQLIQTIPVMKFIKMDE